MTQIKCSKIFQMHVNKNRFINQIIECKELLHTLYA